MFAAPPSIFTLAETASVQLHAVDLANPQLVADLSMPVDFHCSQTLALRGQPGAAGANGSAGQQGGMGGQVQISVGRLNTHAHGAVIFARVDSALGRTYYLLQPGGGALVVDLSGGDGGRGGEGLHAQVEYRDTDSQGNVDRSQITYQGPPGPGGAGGPGGSAVIRVDANDRLLAQAVKVYNPGGPGGRGGVNGRGIGAVQAGGGRWAPPVRCRRSRTRIRRRSSPTRSRRASRSRSRRSRAARAGADYRMTTGAQVETPAPTIVRVGVGVDALIRRSCRRSDRRSSTISVSFARKIQ